MYATFNKCEFLIWLVTFLGHVVSDQGVEVDPKKIEAVKNWLRPLTPTDIQSLFGYANYSCRFVEGFSAVDVPLTALGKKKAKLEWSETCEMIFPELKDRLTLDSVLTLQKSGEGYVVYCDSYPVGLGCILTSDGKVIAYAYGLLKIHEKNYHSQDPEFENVVFALKLLRH